MNAINRVANRVLLFVAGAAVLIGGVAALAGGVLAAGNPPAWLRPVAATTTDAWAAALGWTWTWEIGGIGAVSGLWLLAAAAAAITALLFVVFVCTRKRGGSKTVLEIDTADGRTAVDRDVADAVLTETLNRRPDVLSARTGAYRIGGVRALELAVAVRPGASLGAVVTAAEGAIREWDELLGTRIPIMLHLTDRRWRDAHRSPSRVR